MKALHLLLGFVAFVAIVSIAEPAFACAVCFDANEESRGAFLGTTIFLSLFPLGMIGGLIFWIWRRAVAINAEEASIST